MKDFTKRLGQIEDTLNLQSYRESLSDVRADIKEYFCVEILRTSYSNYLLLEKIMDLSNKKGTDSPEYQSAVKEFNAKIENLINSVKSQDYRQLLNFDDLSKKYEVDAEYLENIFEEACQFMIG